MLCGMTMTPTVTPAMRSARNDDHVIVGSQEMIGTDFAIFIHRDEWFGSMLGCKLPHFAAFREAQKMVPLPIRCWRIA